jgi:hypothetical protein
LNNNHKCGGEKGKKNLLVIVVPNSYNHNPTSQKGHRIAKKTNQNWINIYVSPFKAMAIMASCCFFHSYECHGIQTKNPFDGTLSLSFDLGPLKINTDSIRQ